MANKTIGQLDTVSSVSAVGSYIELEVGGVSKKAYFSESGTWTPTIVGLTSAGTGTYSINEGFYTLCGNVCYFSGYISWSAHTGSGSMRVDGLPFSCRSGNAFIPISINHNNLSMTAGSVIQGYVNPSTTNITLSQVSTGGGAVAGIPIDTSVTYLLISGFYFVA